MDRWIRVEGTRARVTASGHTGAGTAYSCVHTRGKTSRMPCASTTVGPPDEHREAPMIDDAGRWPVERRRDPVGQPVVVGRRGRRLLRRARRLPRRQRVRLGAGGLDRGRARPARGARRHDGARDRRRRGPVLALAGAPPRRAGRRERPVDGDAAHRATDRGRGIRGARAGIRGCEHGIRAAPPSVRRAGAAAGRRERRPRVHGLRRRAVRRRQRGRARGGGPGAAARVGGSCSRRRTRCGGRSRTTRGRTG